MPKWLTEAELKSDWGSARVDQLADRNGDGSPDAGAVAAKIEEAEGRVESKLLTRYAPGDLPTTPETTSDALKRIVSRFAFVALHDLHDAFGANVVLARDEGKAELADICAGNASLLLAGNPDVDVSAPAVHRSSGSSAAGGSMKGTFTAESLADF